MQNRYGAQTQFDGVKKTDFLPLSRKQVTLKNASISPVKEVALSKHRISKEKIPMKRSFIISALGVLAVMLVQACSILASPFYDMKIIAETGQAGLTGIGKYVSINDFGTVAFVGKLAGGEAIFARQVNTPSPINITPGFVSPDHFFGEAVQINNSNYVVSQMRVTSMSPADTFIDVWNGNSTDTHTTIAKGGTASNANYSAVFGQPSLSNLFSSNDSKEVVFSAFKADSNTKLLATKQSPFNEIGLVGLPVSPMISDDRQIVVRAGNKVISPIRLFNYDLGPYSTIADSSQFTEIGQSPGISDDGQVVAFYGNLNSAGATAFSTTAGPGIFASLIVTDSTGTHRTTVRVAGTTGELGKDTNGNPLSFQNYDAASRVGVISEGDQGAVHSFIVAFIAIPNGSQSSFSNQKGIWTVRVVVTKDSQAGSVSIKSSTPLPVAQVGDSVDGRTITDLAVFDPIAKVAKNGGSGSSEPIAERHWIAFWASTNLGDVVVSASHFKEPLIFIAGMAGNYLNKKVCLVGCILWPLNAPMLEELTLDPTKPHTDIIATDAIRLLPNGTVYGGLLDMLTSRGGYLEYDVHDDPSRLTTAGCDYANQKDRHPNLFVFPYDWRYPLTQNVALLKDYIDCVHKFYPNSKVNILTHSTGGLIARRYILYYPQDVDKLVTLGAPWLGTPKGIYVLETGDFGLPWYIYGPSINIRIKSLTEFFPGEHALMPSRSYFDLGGLPFRSYTDRSRNGLPNGYPAGSYYSYDEMVKLFDEVEFPSAKPGADIGAFHDYTGQDDWSNDQSGVKYYHIYGIQSIANTIGQVRELYICSVIIGGCRAHNIPIFTIGDGTVTISSLSRRANGKDLNAPGARLIPIQCPLCSTDKFNHFSMMQNLQTHDAILCALDIECQTQQSQAVVDGSAEQPTEPAYYFKVFGVNSFTLSDALGNSITINPPDQNQIALSTVPGASIYTLDDDAFEVVMHTDQQYTITFPIGADPIFIEVTKGTDETTMQAIRYLDLTLPEGRNAKLQIAPEGVDVLHYDSKGDGTFDTPVTPTVSVAGSQAADVDPPTITVGVTRQLSTTVVTLTAQDSGSGVKDLFYSLDGKQFQLYSSPLDLPVGIRVIYAIADDNVGNRSSLMSFDLLQGLDLSGDVNGDGLIDQADLGRLDAAIAGKNPLSKDEFSRADVAKKCGVNTPKELKKDRSAITKYIKAVVKYNDLISKGKHPKPVKIKDQCHANKVIGQPLVAATTTQPASQAVSKKQRIQVFDLTGKLRIDSGLVDSATLTLKMQQVEDTLANGVYLYVITTQEREGPHTLHELRKLVILK